MNPEVSIIIPGYNHAPFLKQRLDSVLSQSYQNYEVIILDDASTDNSKEIIELYRGHEKVRKIIYNEVNSGSPFKQWQKGLDVAVGKYIWIAESDDYCRENFLDAAVFSLKSLKTGVHYCQSEMVDEENRIIEKTIEWPESITSINWKSSFHMSGKDFVRKALQFKNVIVNASAVVFLKKEIDLEPLNRFRTAGDWLFWVNLLFDCDISYSSEIFNSFRSHGKTTRALSSHQKYVLRHVEVLAVKYAIIHKRQLGDKAELKHFLNVCVDQCEIDDLNYFSKLCKEYKLPDSYLIQFLLRKLVISPARHLTDLIKEKRQIKKSGIASEKYE